MGNPSDLSDLANVFLTPRNTAHRQYEALRAYFVDRRPGKEVANQFGYTLGSFWQLVHEFRRNPDREFFVTPQRSPRSAEDDRIRGIIVTLRKQNLSVYDISESLKKEGVK